MLKLAVYLFTFLVIAACQKTADTKAPEPAPSRSGILLENMDPGVKPGDDFNMFVNGTWINNASIPPDRPYTSIMLDLREQSISDVNVIIQEAANSEFAEGSNEQKVGALFASYMNQEQRDALGFSPLDAEFKKIAALKSYSELAVYLAEANKYGVNLPFNLSQYVDFKNPDTYMIYTWQGGLGMPEREYYFADDEKSVEVRSAYLEHVQKMLELIAISDAQKAAEKIMALETRIAAQHMKKEDTRDMRALYNKVPLNKLSELMPEFSWDIYLTVAGVADIDGLVVTQLEYMRALDDIIVDVSMADWQLFLKWKWLESYATALSSDIYAQHFHFNSRVLQGVEQPLPAWKRAVAVVNSNLGEVVGKIYVKKHFPPEAKARMLELVNNLIKAYEKSINELDWMSEDTREEALEKLSKFTPKIGYPDKWRSYEGLTIKGDDLFGNLQRAAVFEYQYMIERQHHKVDRSEWAMNPQTVNAYYNPPLNEIVFPAAILQPPYFNMQVEDAVNYGAIGAVIGHEIGHGFDDKGSTFDGDGVLRDWWTETDRSEFDARTNRLVEQYSAFKPFDDLAVNGEFTLGENIGDLGGLSIALLAYHMSLAGDEAPVLDGFSGTQRVFIGWAQVWLAKERDEALRTYIKTNVHSPARYRVNGVVRNIPEFYEAFEVQEGDALYLPPEERVKIW